MRSLLLTVMLIALSGCNDGSSSNEPDFPPDDLTPNVVPDDPEPLEHEYDALLLESTETNNNGGDYTAILVQDF